MKKRLEFKCWKCKEPYSLLREIEEGQPVLSVACPFCGAAAICDLDQHRRPVDPTLRKVSSQSVTVGATVYDLPDILPTQPKP